MLKKAIIANKSRAKRDSPQLHYFSLLNFQFRVIGVPNCTNFQLTSLIFVAIRDSLSELSLSSYCSNNYQFSLLNFQFRVIGDCPLFHVLMCKRGLSPIARMAQTRKVTNAQRNSSIRYHWPPIAEKSIRSSRLRCEMPMWVFSSMMLR